MHRIKPERQGNRSIKMTGGTVKLAPAWRGGEGQNTQKARDTRIKRPPGMLDVPADKGNGVTRY